MPRVRTPKHFDPFSVPRKLSRKAPLVLDALVWAWDQETTPREKSVLIAVAAHPGASVEEIAGRCCMSETATLEAVKELAWSSLLVVVEDFGLAIPLAAE